MRRKILLTLLLCSIILVTVGVWYLIQNKVGSDDLTEAQDFSLIDLNGNNFSLSLFQGKVVVIDFMATWCGPCRLQMPYYEIVWEEFGDRIVIISIDIDVIESEDTLRLFAQEYPYATWIWARDTDYISAAYKITNIPTTVIIDQEGYIRFTHIGVTGSLTLIQEIEELLM